jgi:Xaa-Pro aminopeptidase
MFWEYPFIGEAFLDGTETFQEGMVLGVEAFLGREGVGSTAMEQNVIVTSTGTELITTPPMIWY